MRALTVQLGLANSIQLANVPPPNDGDVPVRALSQPIGGIAKSSPSAPKPTGNGFLA